MSGAIEKEKTGEFKSYLLGFISSIILTIAAYLVIASHLLTGKSAVLTIIGLGLIQTFAQLRWFLNLGKEPKSKCNLLMFLLMVIIIVVIVFGSLWIMY